MARNPGEIFPSERLLDDPVSERISAEAFRDAIAEAVLRDLEARAEGDC